MGLAKDSLVILRVDSRLLSGCVQRALSLPPFCPGSSSLQGRLEAGGLIPLQVPPSPSRSLPVPGSASSILWDTGSLSWAVGPVGAEAAAGVWGAGGSHPSPAPGYPPASGCGVYVLSGVSGCNALQKALPSTAFGKAALWLPFDPLSQPARRSLEPSDQLN